MTSAALLPIVVRTLAGLAAATKLRARRRWARAKLSGGRKSLALNIVESR